MPETSLTDLADLDDEDSPASQLMHQFVDVSSPKMLLEAEDSLFEAHNHADHIARTLRSVEEFSGRDMETEQAFSLEAAYAWGLYYYAFHARLLAESIVGHADEIEQLARSLYMNNVDSVAMGKLDKDDR